MCQQRQHADKRFSLLLVIVLLRQLGTRVALRRRPTVQHIGQLRRTLPEAHFLPTHHDKNPTWQPTEEHIGITLHTGHT